MRTFRLAHIVLWTQDLEAATAFWRDYFDAGVGDRYESGNRPGFASRFIRLPGGGVRLELMEGPWASADPGEVSGWAHIALSMGTVARVDEIAEQFRRDGLLVSLPRTTGDGYYGAVVRSPDGTLIEIVE